MTAVTTVTGIGTRVGPATYSYAPRPATQRVRRLSPSTYWRRRLSIATLVLAVVVVAGKAGVALGDSSPLAVFERRPTILTNAPGRVIVVRPGALPRT